MTRIYKLPILSTLIILLTGLASCSDDESYSKLLNTEEKITNWYLARQHICLQIPPDSVFETGSDAPYYKMDDEGYLYMQVINPGDTTRPKDTDKVIFRFMRCNLKNYFYTGEMEWNGNANNMEYATASFHFNSYVYQDSQKYGQGIQIPMKYLGYNCEVNLVLRSYIGFAADQSACIPYALKVKYFKPEY